MLRTAQRIAAATAGGGANCHAAASLAGSTTHLACVAAAAAASSAAACAPRAFLHARSAAAMRHAPVQLSWFHGRGARKSAAQSTDDSADDSRTARPARSFKDRDATADRHDGAAAKDARLFAAAAGQWFELEFIHGGPHRSWAIVHKPAGLSVQAGLLSRSDSVEKRLRLGYGCREIFFPHRIDKHTSGLIVVAFTRGASKALGQSLEAGQWEKKYRAICVVPPAVDLTATAAAAAATETTQAEGKAEPPLLTFTSKFPMHSYPASALLSSYLQGSLWSAVPLLSAPRPPDATDLAGSRTPIGIHLRPRAILRSYLVRRGLPAYSTLDPVREWQKWNRAIVAAPANRLKPQGPSSNSTSSSNQDEYATRIGSFVAASPSKDGQAFHASPSLDRRRLHPFVPETMLYESVPFKPLPPTQSGSASDKRGAKTKGGAGEDTGIDEDDVDEAEITASLSPSSADRVELPKKSVTEFTLLSSNPSARLALYDVSLHTGRSHQIRIHCADAAMPILNDPYYNAYAVYTWMTRAARTKMEDQVAVQLRKEAASKGRKQIITLEDIVRTTDEALRAGTAASEFGCTVFPPPALQPLQPPSFPLRAGPAPSRLKPTGTAVTIAKGTMPKLQEQRERGNNAVRPEMARSEEERAQRAAKKAARSKYDNRRPRTAAAAAARSFFTRSSSGGFSFRARYPVRSAEQSSSSFADGSKSTSNTTSEKVQSKKSIHERFKRKPGFASTKTSSPSNEPLDEPLPVGRSSVGQRTAAPSATRPLVHEHEEYDDDSERRVLKPKPRPAIAAGQTQGNAASQQSPRSPPRSSNPASSSTASASSSQSSSSSPSSAPDPRSPRKPPKKAGAAPPRPSFEFDEGQQFEHALQYQGRRKPFKVRPASEAETDTASTAKPASVRYTSRHDAPKRPSWLPEHVPYRLVAPNPQVDANWQSVLAKYGVGAAAAAAGSAATEGDAAAAVASSTSGAATPARRYKDPNRGAGAVGWLVKDDASLSSAGGASASASAPAITVAALSTPTPAAAATAPASDNHWFASQVAQPAHEMALHAYYLRFPHPSKPGEIITCVQPIMRQWEKIMAGAGGARERRGGKSEQQQQQQPEVDEED